MGMPVSVVGKVKLADPLGNSPAAILYPIASASNGVAVYSITAGGTHQPLASANNVRRGWWLQNHSTGDLWVGKGTTAVIGAPCIKVPAGALYECPAHMVTGDALRIIGAATGQAYSFEEA